VTEEPPYLQSQNGTANVSGEMDAVCRADFRQIYDTHIDYVWRLFRRLGVWERDLEDAAHELFVVVHRRLDDYDPSRPLKPWLAGIATRVASDFRKRAHRRREHAQEAEEIERVSAGQVQSLQHQLEAREEIRLVYRALESLDEPRRTVFVLHDIEGHTMPELQQALDVPLNTLYSRLRSAREMFDKSVAKLTKQEVTP
jgi:RNA polymerase sigma-70 factor (ECF subfamily)